MIMNNYDIKTIIKEGLNKNHMTQAALANTLGIERATVNRWCVGRAIPEADTFLRVCKLLNIRLDAYLYETQDPLSTQLLALGNHLNEKQRVVLLRMLMQIQDLLKETHIKS